MANFKGTSGCEPRVDVLVSGSNVRTEATKLDESNLENYHLLRGNL